MVERKPKTRDMSYVSLIINKIFSVSMQQFDKSA